MLSSKQVAKNAMFQSAASSSGFHFLSLYQCCQRKFYFKWVLGLQEKNLADALVKGAAFHEGKAEWYRSGNESKAVRQVREYVKANATQLGNVMDGRKFAEQVTNLLVGWIRAHGRHDLDNSKVLAVETDYSLTCGSGFTYTGRVDAILDFGDGPVIMETKSSGYSSELTTAGVVSGDQATSYLALCRASFPSIRGVYADVSFFGSYKSGPSHTRSELITRSEDNIAEFIAGVSQAFSEISQKTEAMLAGVKPKMLFSRNTYYCQSYNKRCEYTNICLKSCTLKEAAHGFNRVKPEDRLGDYLLDSITI